MFQTTNQYFSAWNPKSSIFTGGPAPLVAGPPPPTPSAAAVTQTPPRWRRPSARAGRRSGRRRNAPGPRWNQWENAEKMGKTWGKTEKPWGKMAQKPKNMEIYGDLMGKYWQISIRDQHVSLRIFKKGPNSPAPSHYYAKRVKKGIWKTSFRRPLHHSQIATPLSITNKTNINIWRFPQIGVPPNHPFE